MIFLYITSSGSIDDTTIECALLDEQLVKYKKSNTFFFGNKK